MNLDSAAFAQGGAIPVEFTADGANQSPPLRWSAPPGNTQAFALICEDPDAPRGTWIHWLLFNLPAAGDQLQAGISPGGELPGGTQEGTNSWGQVGYGGPSPPRGAPHRYVFRLFALESSLDGLDRPTKPQLEQAMKGHILASTQLIGKYGRS